MFAESTIRAIKAADAALLDHAFTLARNAIHESYDGGCDAADQPSQFTVTGYALAELADCHAQADHFGSDDEPAYRIAADLVRAVRSASAMTEASIERQHTERRRLLGYAS